MNNRKYSPGEILLDKIIQSTDSQFLVADGLEHACIGFDEINERIIYSVSAIITHLQEYDGMSYVEAQEYFDFNIFNAYVGEKTPIWCFDDY